MIELVLVRHAKSDWSSPELDDHDRPLNRRGTRNAPKMAARFAGSGARVERIISSTAVRARVTALAFAEVLGLEVELDPELYGATASTLLSTAAKSGASAVMLVAHDPGITVLAQHLAGGEITRMPTCAVARFVWDEAEWSRAIGAVPVSWTLDTPRDTHGA